MIEGITALSALILLFLCMLAPLKKKVRKAEHPVLYKALRHHSIYAIALLPVALLHGILAGNKPGMISGKAVWMLLLILVLLAYPKRRLKDGIWRRIHVFLSLVLCLLVLVHIGYAALT